MSNFEFDRVRYVVNDHSIIVDGRVYSINTNAADAFVTVDDVTHPMRFQGTLRQFMEFESLYHAAEIRGYKESIFARSQDEFLRSQFAPGDSTYLAYHIMEELLPLLEEFDPRAPNHTTADLVDMRRREIRTHLPVVDEEQIDLSPEVLARSVLDHAAKIQTEYEVDEAAFFRQCSLFWGEKSCQLMERDYTGNVTFETPDGKKRIFRTYGEPQRDALTDRLTAIKKIELHHDVINGTPTEALETFVRICTVSNLMKDKFDDHFAYEASGMMRLRRNDGIFVYVQPVPFAMHDIREGHTEKWYPFRNPPKVGVFVSAGKFDQDESFDVSEPHVLGEFKYLHFESNGKQPRTFCIRGDYSTKPSDTWVDVALGRILYGVYTLYNGADPASLREYSRKFPTDPPAEGEFRQDYGLTGEDREKRMMGEGYAHLPFHSMEPLTEAEVDEEGLLKTNFHDIVPAFRS